MKYYFLIENLNFPEIKFSVKDSKDKYTMILKYFEENKIVSLVDEKDFKPWESKEGRHLVKTDDNEWMVYDVVNTGYFRDYFEILRISKVSIVEFDVTDVVSDADKLTTAMKELVIKNKKLN